MKGNPYNQKRLKFNDARIVESFLFFPRWLPIGSDNGPIQWRWLERATVLQRVGKTIFHELRWFDRYWIEEKEAG